MVKPSHILGLNARNLLYTQLNTRESRRFGFSKLKAKVFLSKHGIAVPTLYAKITTPEELRNFDWTTIEGPFVVKPVNGSEGKGIVVIKRFDRKHQAFIDVAGESWTVDDLRLHVADILQGAYATWGEDSVALIEERIPVHPDLERYVEMGTPDVRVVVYNRIPIMAGCRIPTKQSQGKANIHRGALMLGIDFGTGETTYGLSGLNQTINSFPHNGEPVRGVRLPFWNDLLKTSVRVANATGFVYCGVDMFMHPERGAMVAEVNGFPGLGIQLANRAGLLRRLQRVEEIEARNVGHAVRIAQALFAEEYPMQLADSEFVILSPKEKVELIDVDENKHKYDAMINTGRFRSAISREVAKRHAFTSAQSVLWKQEVEGEGKVPVVDVKFKLKDRVIRSSMIVTKKLDGRPTPVEIGRKDLTGFLVGETGV